MHLKREIQREWMNEWEGGEIWTIPCVPPSKKIESTEIQMIFERNWVNGVLQRRKMVASKSKIPFACFNKQWKWTGCCCSFLFLASVRSLAHSLISSAYHSCACEHIWCWRRCWWRLPFTALHCTIHCPILNFSFNKVRSCAHFHSFMNVCMRWCCLLMLPLYCHCHSFRYTNTPNFSFTCSHPCNTIRTKDAKWKKKTNERTNTYLIQEIR